MILDFTKTSDIALPDAKNLNTWEREIIRLVENWNSSSDFIMAQTSGSTGVPKEIQLPKSAMKMSAELTGKYFDLLRGTSALLCLPANYIAGKMMIVRAMVLGWKLYCVEPKSEIKLNTFIDFVAMTPMQLQKSLSALKYIDKLLVGGAPLSDDIKKEVLRYNTEVYESYGMTETITHIALKKIDGNTEAFHTLSDVKIRLDERDCLLIKTPYFQEEIKTNDIVELTDNEHFIWKARADNVINSGGIKLFPEEIEKKLKPFISQEFIISSVPDEILNQKIVLIIEGEKNTEFEIPKNILTKYETPKEIIFINKFPRTRSGKLLRKEISRKLN